MLKFVQFVFFEDTMKPEKFPENPKFRDLLCFSREKQKILEKAHQIIRESLEEDLARRIFYSHLNSGGILDIEELSEVLNTREKELKDIIKKLENRFSVELS